MLGLALSGCAPKGLDVASQITEDVNTGAACSDFSSKFSATLAQTLIDGGDLPPDEDLRDKLREKFGEDRGDLVEAAMDLYRVVVTETRSRLGVSEKKGLLSAIMALEVGDETTPEKKELKTKIRSAYGAMKASALAMGLDCAPPAADDAAPPSVPTSTALDSILARPVQGAVKVMMTAYQSCAPGRLPAMTAATTPLSSAAVKITGTHENGVGLKREVGDLKALQATHYYIREGIESGSSCFDVRTHPLIYDYGGKPYATTATDSTLDFHTDAGSGTRVLGIDCSGYIFSALAAGGLRVSPTKRLTASLVYGINAKMYMEPGSNGLSCLAPVSSVKDDALRDGDILASSGHIVMVDRVGRDPFGVARLRSLSDCVTANVSVRNFDFDVLQSSPVKNGIGIDRIRASDYFSGSMEAALLAYGVAACKAQFGRPSTVKPADARLVRHKMTPECLDRPVKLEHESCVQSCQGYPVAFGNPVR